jgi:hypothetical protein
MGDEEIGQAVKHVVGSEPSRNDDRQAAPRELVEHHEHTEGPTVVGAVLDEVIRPHVVWPLGSETHA